MPDAMAAPQIGMDMSQTETDPRRKASRDSLFLLAAMRIAGQPETLRVKLRNLSSGGMMAECPVHTVCGDQLTVDLRNVGWVSGRVSWVMENRFGVIFDREIDWKAVRLPVSGPGEAPPAWCRPPIGAAPVLPAMPDHLRRV